MTYEEAKYWFNHNGADISQEIEMAKVINKALEKQIPKKPVRDKEDVFTWLWRCPRCGGRPMQTYCANCGQAIDWSDDE